MNNVILHQNHYQGNWLEAKDVIEACTEEIIELTKQLNDMFMAQGYSTLNEALEQLHNDCGDYNEYTYID